MDKDCSSDGGGFFSLSPTELTLLALALALMLADSLDETQIALLGNFLLAIGVNVINLTPGAWNI